MRLGFRDSVLCTEEPFARLAALYTVKSVKEALEFADDTDYGLAAHLSTRDLNRAVAIAEKLQFGMVGVNRSIMTDPAAGPRRPATLQLGLLRRPSTVLFGPGQRRHLPALAAAQGDTALVRTDQRMAAGPVFAAIENRGIAAEYFLFETDSATLCGRGIAHADSDRREPMRPRSGSIRPIHPLRHRMSRSVWSTAGPM